MELAAEIIFWTSLAAVASTYFVYPAVLLLLSRSRNRPTMSEPAEMPPVTLVISAYNEEDVIRAKIENSLSLDYPKDRLEIMVISDASEDATDRIVAEHADRNVVLHRQDPRGGKSLGLTKFVPSARGEIIVFSDANSMYNVDALRKLLRHFTDERVGFVVGHQRYVETDHAAGVSESLYWRYETFLKVRESEIGSVVCGDGAMYAIRAELFEPLRADDINDFTIPLKIIVRGRQGVFDPEAICYERTADDFLGEFRRKVRIVNRSLRAVIRVPGALNPLRVGFFAIELAVHKLLRWFVPFFLVFMLAASTYLAVGGSPFYQALLWMQVAFYVLAVLRLVPGLRDFKPVYVANYFCVVNLAAALGVLGFLFGKRIATWTPQRLPLDGSAARLGQ